MVTMVTETFIQNTSRKISSTYWEGHLIAFHKMESIRNYIFRTDINEKNDKKNPKITTPCYSCRKTCHLINGDKTLKNIHNWKEIKTLDGGNCRTANIAHAARCKIHGDIYYCNTGEEVRKKSIKHRYDAKNRSNNNKVAAHIHRYQHEFDEDIEYWYQMEIYIKSMKKNYGKTNSYAYSLLNTNAPTELNIKLEHYRRQLYEGFANLTV